MKKLLCLLAALALTNGIATATLASSETRYTEWTIPAAYSYNMFFPNYENYTGSFYSGQPAITHTGTQWATQVLDEYNGKNKVMKLNESGLYLYEVAAIGAPGTIITLETGVFVRYGAFESEVFFWAMKDDEPIEGYDSYLAPTVLERIWDGGWEYTTLEIIIPEEMDYFVIGFRETNHPETYNDPYNSVYVDYINVKTQSIPEPATLTLLALGGFLLKKKTFHP